jgi:hypothetical protein
LIVSLPGVADQQNATVSLGGVASSVGGTAHSGRSHAMRNTCQSRQTLALSAVALIAAAAFVPLPAAADPASGTINYQSKAGAIAVTVANVYLIKGPDAASGKTIRQLIFTPADLSQKIQACASLSCVSGNVSEGMTVDFDAGPRLNYWVVGNGQKIQYSGTARPDEVLKVTADGAERLAGTLTIDDGAMGGAKADVKFDAKLVKQFSK